MLAPVSLPLGAWNDGATSPHAWGHLEETLRTFGVSSSREVGARLNLEFRLCLPSPPQKHFASHVGCKLLKRLSEPLSLLRQSLFEASSRV